MFIGAVTFTGSIIAYLKLSAKMKSSPLTLPGRNWLNLGALIVSAALLAWYLAAPSIWPLIIMTVIALVLGLHLVAAIGGGDMPVVVSMLNSYSGWAAAAAGFMLSNNLLIITGALVGSSGAILSYIMCKAMNRSFIAVILGGFGTEAATSTGDQDLGEYHETTIDQLAELLDESQSIVIAPGYGMAVAKAQNQVAELTEKLRHLGKDVRFAVHPVAGRLPGHMNVLLAEARVPYDIVLEMDEIQDELPRDRCGAGDRRQRHGEPRRRRGPRLADRRDARPAGLEGQARRGLQAVDGHRVRRRAEPAVLQGQRANALR